MRAEIPVLPFEYQLSENGDQFSLFDSGHGDDYWIWIFGTDQAVQLLANSGKWYCNLTFSVCPNFQMYTIHARNNTKTILCIFGLLPSKTRTTYDRFFSEILIYVLAAGNEPNTIFCDFDYAAINSASATFPNADISGCFFHLCSNIWKKIQSTGLHVQYNNDQEFTLHLQIIPALVFIPPNDEVDAFERLTDLIRNQYGDATDGVIDYFEDTYITFEALHTTWDFNKCL